MSYSDLASYSWMGYVIFWVTSPTLFFVSGVIVYKLLKIRFKKSSKESITHG